MKMASAQQIGRNRLRRQMTGRRTASEILDLRVAAIVIARFELETGRVLFVDVDVTAIQTLLDQGFDHKAPERIVADPAQPRDVETQARQPDRDIAVGPGDALVKVFDCRQITGLLGDQHRHGFAERENIDLRHEQAPDAIGRGGRGRRRARWSVAPDHHPATDIRRRA
ncbi:hypothetical protein D3C72_1090900 [compost metagenome]